MVFALAAGLLICAGVFLLALLLAGSTQRAARQYGQRMTIAANTELAELFIFVDVRTLRLIAAAGFVGIAAIVYLVTGSLPVALLSGAAVFLIPTRGVALLRARRQTRFNKALPDALQSTANMLRSGLNLSGALEFVAADDRGPVGQEFGLLLNELKMGIKFERALDNMHARIPIEDLQLVVAAMKISRDVGGSLADVLARLADTIRRRIEMEGKIDSLTAMGKLQGLVMTLLPVGVGYAIFRLEPQAMMQLFTTWHGWIVCVVLLGLEAAGVVVIRKIVAIDV